MFGQLGLTEILIIFAVVLLLFGAKRIPGIGKGLGQAISNFTRELRGETRSGMPPSSDPPPMIDAKNRSVGSRDRRE